MNKPSPSSQWLAAGLLCLIFFGSCRKTEKILPDQDGVWTYESWEEKRFEEGVEVQDSFATSGLGGLVFMESGEGYAIDDAGQPVSGSAFDWSVDGDLLIRTGSNGIPIQSVILDNRRKGQLWATNTEYELDLGNGLVMFRTERVESLLRK